HVAEFAAGGVALAEKVAAEFARQSLGLGDLFARGLQLGGVGFDGRRNAEVEEEGARREPRHGSRLGGRVRVQVSLRMPRGGASIKRKNAIFIIHASVWLETARILII